jgi:hypothetical protein
MLANTFSHGLIRDFVISFGTLFNNIKINRRPSTGETASTIAVPLIYSPKNKYLTRIEEDLALDKPVAITLPRMSFEMVSTNYSAERKLNTIHRVVKSHPTSNTVLNVSYTPVPYDFSFQLHIYTGNIEDGTHIIEQILPYFTPEFTISLKSATSLGINLDLPIILNSVGMEDTYEGSFDDRRVITWTLDYTLKGNLFGPITNAGIVNKAVINLHPTANVAAEPDGSANGYDQIVSRPAMSADGSASTDAASSVLVGQIGANDDFGIASNIFNY